MCKFQIFRAALAQQNGRMNADVHFASHVSALLPIAAVFVLAGLVKGVIGLGLPTISMALLGSMMSPAEAAALLVVPSLATTPARWPARGPSARPSGRGPSSVLARC